MLEFLDSGPDVVALRIGGRIDAGELDAVMDRLEPMLAAADKTHLYVEVDDISGMSLDGLARYSRRALPLLTKLDRFGRVAVVSDQDWVRLAAKFESAVLPHVTYRTFKSHQRGDALAWVKDGTELV